MNNTLICILVVAGVALGLGLPAYLGILFYRKYQANAKSKLDSILASYHYVGNNDAAHQVIFHTYHGFLIWGTQIKHVIQFDPNNIEPVINQLNGLKSFNFKWGLFAYGALFIPVLTYFEYKKAIKTLHSYKI